MLHACVGGAGSACIFRRAPFMVHPARRLFVAFSLALAALLATDLGVTGVAQAQLPFFTSAPRYASIVVDASNGEVLYERNPDSPRYPASISKVMTLYLT